MKADSESAFTGLVGLPGRRTRTNRIKAEGASRFALDVRERWDANDVCTARQDETAVYSDFYMAVTAAKTFAVYPNTDWPEGPSLSNDLLALR
jgi:hypothetical protein